MDLHHRPPDYESGALLLSYPANGEMSQLGQVELAVTQGVKPAHVEYPALFGVSALVVHAPLIGVQAPPVIDDRALNVREKASGHKPHVVDAVSLSAKGCMAVLPMHIKKHNDVGIQLHVPAHILAVKRHGVLWIQRVVLLRRKEWRAYRF